MKEAAFKDHMTGYSCQKEQVQSATAHRPSATVVSLLCGPRLGSTGSLRLDHSWCVGGCQGQCDWGGVTPDGSTAPCWAQYCPPPPLAMGSHFPHFSSFDWSSLSSFMTPPQPLSFLLDKGSSPLSCLPVAPSQAPPFIATT